jgi:hypothetical protein
MITAVAMALLSISSSCKRSSTSARPTARATPPVAPVWLDARITRSRDGFFADDTFLISHRFTVPSGEQATYDDGDLRLEVAPKSNGDSTLTIAATFADHRDKSAPIQTQVTVVDGHATTHQAGGIRFNFLATTNPKLFASLDAAIPHTTFMEGTYVLPPTYFAGASYTFEHGSLTVSGFTDAGPQPAPQKGRYQIDGERITLNLSSPTARVQTLNHRTVDGVHLLLRDNLVATFDAQQRLPSEELYGFYILIPPETQDFMEWWRSLAKNHPALAKLLPEKPR